MSLPDAPIPGNDTTTRRSRRQGYIAAGTIAALLVAGGVLAALVPGGPGQMAASSSDTDAAATAAPDVADVPSSGGTTPGLGSGPLTSQPNQPGSSVALPAGVPDASTGLMFGNPSAATSTVVFWADPSCPYCKAFDADYGDLLVAAADDGTATVEWRIVAFLSEGSVRAGNALMCAADQNRFHEYRTVMYQQQPTEGTDEYQQEDLLTMAGAATVPDLQTFTECVTSGRYTDYVNQMTASMSAAGVPGTPALLLDGVNVLETGVPFETFVSSVGLDVQDYLGAGSDEANEDTAAEPNADNIAP